MLVIASDGFLADPFGDLRSNKPRKEFVKRQSLVGHSDRYFPHKSDTLPLSKIGIQAGCPIPRDNKEKTTENVVFSRVWCSSGDSPALRSGPGRGSDMPPACHSLPLPSNPREEKNPRKGRWPFRGFLAHLHKLDTMNRF